MLKYLLIWTYANMIRMLNSLDLDQAWHYVKSDMDLNCVANSPLAILSLM